MLIKLPKELAFLKKTSQKESTELLTDKVCVVTGGTSGVGLAGVKELAKGGAHIVLVARNLEKAKKVQEELIQTYHSVVDIFIADFSRLDEVRQVALDIINQYNRIDILINSVGIHNTKKQYNIEGYEMVFCVNHLSTFLFTYLLLPTMKQSAPSRIIQVNSEGHRFNGLRVGDLHWKKRWFYTGLRSYGASKTAQLLTTWEFADMLKGTGVTINAMHPGAVKTNIGNNNGWLYRWFLHHITWLFLKDPIISGKALYYLASAKELESTSGLFFNLTNEEIPAKHALNRLVGKEVWDKSLEYCHIKKEVKP